MHDFGAFWYIGIAFPRQGGPGGPAGTLGVGAPGTAVFVLFIYQQPAPVTTKVFRPQVYAFQGTGTEAILKLKVPVDRDPEPIRAMPMAAEAAKGDRADSRAEAKAAQLGGPPPQSLNVAGDGATYEI